jgi:hypothetical protein
MIARGWKRDNNLKALLRALSKEGKVSFTNAQDHL